MAGGIPQRGKFGGICANRAGRGCGWPRADIRAGRRWNFSSAFERRGGERTAFRSGCCRLVEETIWRRRLGLPLDPVQAAEMILTRGEAVPLDAARVRTADGAERLYMGGGGVGLDAEAARFASGVYRKMRGRSRYLLSAIRALGTFRGIDVRVSLEGAEQSSLQGTALVLGILNTPSYGGGLRLAPEARLEDGRLDLVLLENLSALEIAGMLAAPGRQRRDSDGADSEASRNAGSD